MFQRERERERSDQIRSDQIRSDQIRSDQIRSDQIRSDQIRSDQIRSDQIRSDQIRSDQISLYALSPQVASTIPLSLCQCWGLQPAKPLAVHQSSEMARSFSMERHGAAFKRDQSFCGSLCQGQKLKMKCQKVETTDQEYVCNGRELPCIHRCSKMHHKMLQGSKTETARPSTAASFAAQPDLSLRYPSPKIPRYWFNVGS